MKNNAPYSPVGFAFKSLTHEKLFLYASAFLFLFAVASCKKDNHDHDHDHEQELITTVKLVFTPSGGGTPVEFKFTDNDGIGGNPPVIINDTLSANTSYSLVVSLLNESVSPAVDVTREIRMEGKEHQLFYAVENGLNLTITYNDADVNGKPIGLLCNAVTGNASSGTLTVTLRHQPNKNAANVSSGNITNAGGETDAEVTFNVTIL
jgi:hypothetical protein